MIINVTISHEAVENFAKETKEAARKVKKLVGKEYDVKVIKVDIDIDSQDNATMVSHVVAQLPSDIQQAVDMGLPMPFQQFQQNPDMPSQEEINKALTQIPLPFAQEPQPMDIAKLQEIAKRFDSLNTNSVTIEEL
jgi:hypothetical protein